MPDIDSLEDAEDIEDCTEMDADSPDVQQATAIVRAENKATVALLQRRMNIGFARAARLIDALEELGVIGPDNGGGPREVLPADAPTDDDMEGGEC